MTQWLLSYPKGTEERELTFRHHYALLSDDLYVQCLNYHDDESFWHIVVQFYLGYNQPARAELQALDVKYPLRPRRTCFEIVLDDDDF
jgi:hypothetical protein